MFLVRPCSRQPRCYGSEGAFHARRGAARRRYGNGGGLPLRAARTMAAPLLSAALCGVRGGRAFGTAGETRAGEPRFPTSGQWEPFGGE